MRHRSDSNGTLTRQPAPEINARSPSPCAILTLNVQPFAEHQVDPAQLPLDSSFEARAVSPTRAMGTLRGSLVRSPDNVQVAVEALCPASRQHHFGFRATRGRARVRRVRQTTVRRLLDHQVRRMCERFRRVPRQAAGRGPSDRAALLPGLAARIGAFPPDA